MPLRPVLSLQNKLSYRPKEEIRHIIKYILISRGVYAELAEGLEMT